MQTVIADFEEKLRDAGVDVGVNFVAISSISHIPISFLLKINLRIKSVYMNSHTLYSYQV